MREPSPNSSLADVISVLLEQIGSILRTSLRSLTGLVGCVLVCLTLVTVALLFRVSEVSLNRHGAQGLTSFIREIQRPGICAWLPTFVLFSQDYAHCQKQIEAEAALRKKENEAKALARLARLQAFEAEVAESVVRLEANLKRRELLGGTSHELSVDVLPTDIFAESATHIDVVPPKASVGKPPSPRISPPIIPRSNEPAGIDFFYFFLGFIALLGVPYFAKRALSLWQTQTKMRRKD